MSRRNDFQDFLRMYNAEIQQEGYTTLGKSKCFAKKLFGDYLGYESLDDVDEDKLYILDGCGDGGIDIAYLSQSTEDDTNEGDTWYIVQSKYGKSNQGVKVLKDEAEKVFNTLQGNETNVSHGTKNLVERVRNFISRASEQDRLVYLFLTENYLTSEKQRALDDMRAVGKHRFGNIFDVENYSIKQLFDMQTDFKKEDYFVINFKVNLISAGNDVFVGLSNVEDLYKFLKSYSEQMGNLDILYERNIRFFLSFKTRINKKLKETLEEEPENFGLYNNGITIAVEEIRENNGQFTLTNPKIVNGCQTTQAIYRVLKNKLDSGGTGIESSELAEWKAGLQQSTVVVKIVAVKENGNLLNNITRYTNSQNAVKEKDFIALESWLKDWQKDMENDYNIYLEVQSGGWNARKVVEIRGKRKPFTDNIKLFQLIKIYASGWLGKAGLAYNADPPFAPPNGKVFKEISALSERGEFNSQDLYMAYCLKKMADEYKFGRGAEKDSRRFTRCLFYMAVVEFVKIFMEEVEIEVTNNRNITRSLTELYNDEETKKKFFDTIVKFIDAYMDPKGKDTIFCEPEFSKKNKDVRRFLMWDKCGQPKDSPCFRSKLDTYKQLIELNDDIQIFTNKLKVVKVE